LCGNCFPFQKSISSTHFNSENCEINSIKFDLPRAFQQHQESTQIPIQFLILILVSFYWKNDSIINSFHTVAPSSLKPSDGTPTPFQRYQEHDMKHHGLEDLSMTKQNKLPSLIDKCSRMC
jgi:hypothetical protein